jgi:CHAD domain-containing protein
VARPSRGALAALLVGVTIGLAALARAERNRRAPRSRPAARERHFGLLAYETPASGLERIALAQLDLAIELLRGEAAVAPDETVHETRKALKRLRALLRLLESELGRKRAADEQAVLRDAATRLAGARDAEVMVRTLEHLLRRHPRRLRRRRALIELREALERERAARAAHALGGAGSGQMGADPGQAGVGVGPIGDGVGPTSANSGRTRDGVRQTGADSGQAGTSFGSTSRAEARAPSTNGTAAAEARDGNRDEGEHAQIAANLAALRMRVSDWNLRDRSLEQIVQPGMRRVYRKGRARWIRAAARKPSARALHRWRKEVKDLRYVVELLDVRPSPATPAAGRRAAKLAQRADALGELLGEEHDLALLAERVRKHDELKRHKRARRALLRTIARRRARLREQALRAGGRLYRRKPRRFAGWVWAGSREPAGVRQRPRR